MNFTFPSFLIVVVSFWSCFGVAFLPGVCILVKWTPFEDTKKQQHKQARGDDHILTCAVGEDKFDAKEANWEQTVPMKEVQTIKLPQGKCFGQWPTRLESDKLQSMHPRKACRGQHNACKEKHKETDCTLRGGLNNE